MGVNYWDANPPVKKKPFRLLFRPMASEPYNNVTIQMMGDDETPVSNDLISKSVFFQAAFSLNLARVIGPAADDVNTESLGHLWGDVLPIDGKYTFEIATVLPYYLPDFDDASEYVIEIDGAELVVSSRMVRCFYSDSEEQINPLQYYLVHRRGIPNLLEQKGLTHIHPIPLRTFIAKRFSADGPNAEQIVQAQFNSWVREFVSNLSRFLDSLRAASPKDAKHLLPQMATPFLSIFWVYVSGNGKKSGIAQFAGDMPSVAFRSLHRFDKEAVEKATAYLADGGTISVQESALGLANTYLHYGYLGLALVQVCIACESVLAQTYQTFLLSRGVSKTKYEDAERDITFSQLLNLHLAAARNLSKLKNREKVLGQLNWARKHRNEVVHKGDLQSEVKTQEVETAIEAARELVQFLTVDSEASDR